MHKKYCAGCKSNFYNYPNELGVKECWNLKTASLVTKFRIHMDMPMNIKANYTKVRIPSCYYGGGYSGTGCKEVDKIPYNAK